MKSPLDPKFGQPQDGSWNVGEGAGAIVLVEENRVASNQMRLTAALTPWPLAQASVTTWVLMSY
ncbi:hypothetical protein O9929_05210 [Vibrio lentus]|nr:hypothetical protein [Vibrio lentus]